MLSAVATRSHLSRKTKTTYLSVWAAVWMAVGVPLGGFVIVISVFLGSLNWLGTCIVLTIVLNVFPTIFALVHDMNSRDEE